MKFLDLYDNESYSLEDLLKTKIEIKSLSFSQEEFGHYLFVYSENGNEFKIDLFSFRYEIYARKVETTLTKLFDEFYANSAVRYIGETMVNITTASRILISIVLLFFPAFSSDFTFC